MQEKSKKNLKFNILAIVLIILFVVSISPVNLQNDTFYTIKIGEHLLETGTIDRVDPFSWHENLTYMYPHWLYDIIIYLIYMLGGFTGIYISTCVLTAILGISIYFINTKLVKNHLISFMITIGSIYLLAPYIAARAQLVTFILFIWTIFGIEKFLETKKKRYALMLIVIPIIIANVHSAVWPFYFVLFMPYIGEYLIAVFMDILTYGINTEKRIHRKIEKLRKFGKQGSEEKIIKLEEELKQYKGKIEEIEQSKANKEPYKLIVEKNHNIKWLILVMVICLFTGLLTPIGDMPYTYYLRTSQGNTMENISEHLPLILINHTDIIVTLIIYLGVLIFTDSKIKLRDLFMLGGLVFLMFMSRRQASMVALITCIILNRLITFVLEKHDKGGIDRFEYNVVKIPGMIITTCFIAIVGFYFLHPKLDDKYIEKSSYPVQACDYILENLDVENMKIYNDYNYGSYMLYRNIPVYIDSRCDLYTPEFNDGVDIFTEYIDISAVNVDYDSKFNERGITHVITYSNSKLSKAIENRNDQKYDLIYLDENFKLYEIKD